MITVIGLGPGGQDYLVPQAQAALKQATVIVGHPRQLAAIGPHNAAEHILDAKLSELVLWLQTTQSQTPEASIVVLASGDPMLYGIGKYLTHTLGHEQVAIISGISAIQYLFARIKLDMNDLYLTSSHGRTPDFEFIFAHSKVAMVTDKIIGPYEIAQELIARNLTHTMIIGENLSYPDERIETLIPQAVENRPYPLNIVIISHER